MRLRKNYSGITLIALVITIIVLLILAGISISMLTGENGLLTKASDAKDKTIIGQEEEQIKLAYNTAYLDLDNTNMVEKMQSELNKLAGEGNTTVSARSTNMLNVLYTATNHSYSVSLSNGKITLSTSDGIDFENDPIVDVSSTYILRASGKMSSYLLPDRNRNDEEYDPIESNETLVGENVRKIGDDYYIDSENKIHIKGIDQVISNVKDEDIITANPYVLTNDGKLYIWGDNTSGQIGNGTTNNSDLPICLNELSGNALYGKNIVSAGSSGYDSFYAIDSDGKAYAWGSNDNRSTRKWNKSGIFTTNLYFRYIK